MISDIHSNIYALDAVLRHLEDVDILITCGDTVGYGANPNEVIERLKEYSILNILGNHDVCSVLKEPTRLVSHAAMTALWTGDQLEKVHKRYLQQLSFMQWLQVEDIEILTVHGSFKEPLTEYIYPYLPEFYFSQLLADAESDLVILGHTHIPFQIKVNKGVVINPGSVGQPRDGDPKASYVILTIIGDHIDLSFERVPYNIDAASKAILDAGLPEINAKRLFFGK
ncbi:MAG: metallophosphoesterase family protein [Candidatus Heimdallarchaeota archaeon]